MNKAKIIAIGMAVVVAFAGLLGLLTFNEFVSDKVGPQVPGLGSWGFAPNPAVTYEAHTSSDTLTSGEINSIHSNLGASGNITLTLPDTTASGYAYEFVVQAAQRLHVDIANDAGIYINGALQADGKLIWADDEGESVKLVNDGNGNWTAMYTVGTWTVES